MATTSLRRAKAERNDEFYTQYPDIEKEIDAYVEFDPGAFRGKSVLLPCDDPEWSNFTKFFAQNFSRLGLRKLVSTSYAPLAKRMAEGWAPSIFERSQGGFDPVRSRANGRIFVLEGDVSGDGRIDADDLRYDYLSGTGDFRSDEVRRLRDEADIVVTNPPFSLFREFVPWIFEAGKKCVIVGNMNAITYSEVFPLLKSDRLWLGATGSGSDMVFGVPSGAKVSDADRQKAAKLGYVGNYTRMGNACWFTNMEHGRRHTPLTLMTAAENLRFSRHKDIRGRPAYARYDNYDALEVPYVDAIPSDYGGAMGVPVTFLDKYCPEQFEILGCTESEGKGFSNGLHTDTRCAQPLVGGERRYKRLFIRHRGANIETVTKQGGQEI